MPFELSKICRHADSTIEMPAFGGMFAPVCEITGGIAQMAIEDVFAIGRIRRDRQEVGRSPFERNAQGGVHESAFVYADVRLNAIAIAPSLGKVYAQRQRRIGVFTAFCSFD